MPVVADDLLSAVLQACELPIIALDLQGRVQIWSKAAEEVFGWCEGEMLGEFPPFAAELGDSTAETRCSPRIEVRTVRKDGTWILLNVSIASIVDQAGTVTGSVIVARDISEQKAVEQERTQLLILEREARSTAEELAAQQAAILAQMAETVIMCNDEGTLVYMNDAARDLFGVDAVGLPVESYPEVFHVLTPEGRPLRWEEMALARVVRDRQPVRDLLRRIRRADGSEVVVQGNATPVVGPDGRVLGAVLTMRDITAQVQLDLERDDFLVAVAHDLKTPVTSIKGFAQMLQRRIMREHPEDNLDLLAGLDRIDATSNRMAALINHLLDITRLQMGRRVEIERRSCDLMALIRGAVAEHQPHAERHPISLDADAEEIVGWWDGHRLERVVTNLLSNAIKYSPHGGHIHVCVSREDRDDGPWAIITVRDQGVGIPDADLPHIFDRFYRGSNVTGRVPGTGIGLVAVRYIVEQHGGRISVTSKEQEGTIFTIELPVVSADETAPYLVVASP